jgi:hypothetical protein
MLKAILITGGTGKQAQAVVWKFPASPESNKLFGVTRKGNSLTFSELLKSFHSLSLVTGTFDNPNAIFQSVPQRVSGVSTSKQL